MNILLTFDSTPFTKHLTDTDDRNMIDFIIREYGPALQSGISMYGDEGIEWRIAAHYQDAYFRTVLQSGNHFIDESNPKLFRRRVVDDEGNVITTKGRYDELVEVCVENFNSQVVAVLRGIQYQARRIFTVDVVGYENRTLKVLLKTDGAIQP